MLAGLVPLLAAAVRLAGLVALHVVLVRRPLLWLSLKRRVSARLTLKLLLALLAVAGLGLDVLVAPALSLAAPVASAVTLAFSVAYAETALHIIRSRVLREAQDAPLGLSEWALPAVLLGLVGLLAAGLVGAASLAHTLLNEANLPAVHELVRWLLPVGE